jgi:hypothetical protein
VSTVMSAAIILGGVDARLTPVTKAVREWTRGGRVAAGAVVVLGGRGSAGRTRILASRRATPASWALVMAACRRGEQHVMRSRVSMLQTRRSPTSQVRARFLSASRRVP